ncbi:MAG: hemerythrin domain-containing protein [Pseudomonadota bacterium]
MLREDHRKVEALFDQFESARKSERKQSIVKSICEELTLHAALEESVFYPAIRQVLTLKKDLALLDEAVVEHATLKGLIAKLESSQPDARFYDATVTVLKEYVNHHVKEEEKEIFAKVRKSALSTMELGQVMQAAREKLKRKFTH